MKRALLVAMVSMVAAAGSAAAEPTIGTAVDYGESVVVSDSGRVGASLYVVHPVGERWLVGGELAGSLGGYTGGYGCGTLSESDDMVPAVAVSCLVPALTAHGLVAHDTRLGTNKRLRLEAGVGVTNRRLFPGQGGDNQSWWYGSAQVRGAALLRVGSGAGGQWWTGVQLQQRTYGVADPHASVTLGWLLEAVVVD